MSSDFALETKGSPISEILSGMLFTVIRRLGTGERLLQLLNFYHAVGDGIVPVYCSVKNLNLRIKN